MNPQQPLWPTDQINPDAVSRWITDICAREIGPPIILQLKSWGVTARFDDLVFKASFTPLFPQVTEVHAVLDRIVPTCGPQLIASTMVKEQVWTLFEYIPGPTAEEVGTPEALLATARELARVQGAAAAVDLSRIPEIDPIAIPELLLDDLEDQPAALVGWLRNALPALQGDAEILAALPRSLDHPDMNASNAIVCDDGHIVLLDWEAATAGCPLFSLDRLLQDAREHSAVEPVIRAYLDAVPWGGRHELECALRLVPLKLALEARAFARALGWPHPNTGYTSRLLMQARERGVGV